MCKYCKPVVTTSLISGIQLKNYFNKNIDSETREQEVQIGPGLRVCCSALLPICSEKFLSSPRNICKTADRPIRTARKEKKHRL